MKTGRRRFLEGAAAWMSAAALGCGSEAGQGGSGAGGGGGGALGAAGGAGMAGGPGGGAGGAGAGGAGAPRGALNVLVIMVDQMRSIDYLPSTTGLPTYERLLAKGVLFARHHVAAAPCTPSRSVLYTGRHAPLLGMTDNINFAFVPDLSPDTKTLGTRFREAGYVTAYKGKWHLSDVEKSIGCQGSTANALEPYGFSDWNDCGDIHGDPRGGYREDAGVADAAIDWIEKKAPQLGKPWLLAVNFVNPHDVMFVDTDGVGMTQRSKAMVPLLPPPKSGVYAPLPKVTLPTSLGQGFDGRPSAHREIADIYAHTFGEIPVERDDMWRTYLGYYVACQLDVDAQVGRVLDALERAGLLSSTVVVFAGDHGEMGGAHGARQKGCFLYRENWHVPLVVWHPDVAGGSATQALSSGLDLVPTLLGLAGLGAGAAEGLVGHDLSPLVASPSGLGPREGSGVLMTYDALTTVDLDWVVANASSFANPLSDPTCSKGEPDVSKRGFLRGVFDGRYRFARYWAPGKPNRPASHDELVAQNDLELYDTEQDPGETTNLASPERREANSQVIEQMRQKLEALIDAEIGDDGYVVPVIEQC